MFCVSQRWVLLGAVCTWPLPAFPYPLTAFTVHSSMVQLHRLANEINLEALSLSLMVRTYQICNSWLQWPWFLSLGKFWFLQKGRHLAISSLFKHDIRYSSNCQQTRIRWWGRELAWLQAAGKIWGQFVWIICQAYWSKQKYVTLGQGIISQVERGQLRHYGKMEKIRSKEKNNNSSWNSRNQPNQAKSLTR